MKRTEPTVTDKTTSMPAIRGNEKNTEKNTEKRPEKRRKAKPAVKKKEAAPDAAAIAAAGVQKRKKRIAYMVFTAVTALMVIVLAVVLRGVSDMRSYTDYMERGQSYYSAGQLDYALLYFRKAANIDATDECLVLIANCYESQGNLDSAIDTLKKLGSQEQSIIDRLTALEERRSRMSETGLVTVAGNQYAVNTTGLVLDNIGLTDAALTEVQQLYSLSNLSLADNQISDVSALASIGGLTTLNLGGNNISNISPLASLTSLRTLYLDDNPITDLTPLYSLTNLTTLSIKGIGITESQLKTISATLPNCAIHSETASEEAQDISLGGVTFKSDVTELNLSGMGIRDASALSACKNLTSLNLSGNDLSDLSGIMDIPNLTYLDISNNNVSDVRPLMGMTTLRSVVASGNNISNTVPFGALKGLVNLTLDNNPIINYAGLKKLYNLQALSLNSVGLPVAELEKLYGLSALLSLNIENNPELNGESVDELKRAIPTCTVTHSELTYAIMIDGYEVSSEATSLDLSGCGVTDITGITRLDKLVSVNLARNNINNIYAFQYCASTTKLTYLDLSSNYLEDITAVAAMSNLETLDISYNSISLIGPLLVLSNLKTLRLTGNPMTAEQIAEIQAALPYCEIISE